MNWKNVIKFVINNAYWIVATIRAIFKNKKKV